MKTTEANSFFIGRWNDTHEDSRHGRFKSKIPKDPWINRLWSVNVKARACRSKKEKTRGQAGKNQNQTLTFILFSKKKAIFSFMLVKS